MSLYERRSGRLGRSLSLMIGDLFSNRPGPSLGFAAGGGSTAMLPVARSLPCATSCYLELDSNNNRERASAGGATDPLAWMNEVHNYVIYMPALCCIHGVYCFVNLFRPFLLYYYYMQTDKQTNKQTNERVVLITLP